MIPFILSSIALASLSAYQSDWLWTVLWAGIALTLVALTSRQQRTP